MNENDYIKQVQSMVTALDEYIELPNPDNWNRVRRELLSLKQAQQKVKLDGVVPNKIFSL